MNPKLLRALPAAALVSSVALAQGDPAKPFQILPNEITWVANPAIPAGGEIAVLVGGIAQPGRYAFRVKFPPDYRIMPHRHPDERIYTVVSGTWLIGLGETFDSAKLTALPVGSLFLLPAKTPHFHWARAGASIVQVNGTGPTATEYVDPANDPRRR